MSHPLLMALFKDVSSAAAAAHDAHALGVDRADLSVVARDHQDEGRIAKQIDASPGSEIEDSPAASRLGELSGYILAAIAIGLPGTGAVVAAGPLAAELGEVAGHVAGQVSGDLKATLMKTGMSETDADEWRAQIEGGRGILLGVHARNAPAADIEALLSKNSSGRVVHTQWED
jgi:Na+(H+)/acetate symporter ActP